MTTARKIDGQDATILNGLPGPNSHGDFGLTVADLARPGGGRWAASAVHERLARLERDGLVRRDARGYRRTA